LLSASGIHLYAISHLSSLGLKALLGRMGWPAGFALGCARGASGALWLFCWGLAGLRPGMLRPLLLVGLRQLAEMAGFRWRSAAPLLAALAIDLVSGLAHGAVSPRGLGYGLAVVGGLAGLRAVAVTRGARPGRACFRAELALATGSWVFLALLEAWQDSTIALATPVLSLLTLPALGLLGYPLLVLAALARAAGLAPLSSGLAAIAATGTTAVVASLARAAMALPSLWVVARGPLLLGAALAVPAAAIASATRRRQRFPAVAGALLCAALALRALLYTHSTPPRPRHILDRFAMRAAGVLPARELRQLAVGQGDAALVVGPTGKAGLIDAGSEHAVTDSRWIGMLARSGATRLDWVALTHLDEDHAGGLHSLLRLLPIACAETARAQWEAPRGQALARLLAVAGTRPGLWGSGCVPFPTLAPDDVREGANEAMGAVWVPLPAGSSYLSAGDATARDEPRIGAWARALSERWESAGAGKRILKVSHHGSKTSSAPEFLREFAPDELWISVGRGNLYGHPNPEVLTRLEALGRPVHRTDVEGELRAGARAGAFRRPR
jgi:competence protein ComEC